MSRILVVDDSRVARAVLTALLNAAGYPDVRTADSVGSAFALLGVDTAAPIVPCGHCSTTSAPGGGGAAAPPPAAGEIDLILMDITMPEVDGIAAIRRIRATAALRDIPIIVVTGRVEPGNLQVAFDAGAMDYITKPLHEIELAARVKSALRLKDEMDQRKARERELVQVLQQLETANRLLAHSAATDGLTGVANRRQFDSVLAAEWGRARRHNTWLALIMVDIDKFKQYNDTYGHQGGDACLKTVADILLTGAQRSTDLVARYGGEEFALILPGTDLEGSVFVAERLRVAVEEAGIVHAASTVSDHVTLSLGAAAMLPRCDNTPASLVAAADKALYQAKQEGRNRVRRAP